ncbi:CsbD family protein [Streptococcus suis]|uniref:CsbD family protein n=1 Tax=Streptococcus suis TaxID=1307 RepID=UPI000CF4D718|nr:CsbD family protein [Streptococcus suis]MBY5009132.1 CsbD family protein [Streptococcus suis]MDG4518847.1 CsbD family protein [Streptococcus suis]HEM3623845.1 CsbD family protein [Streptococcus suis]
MSVEKFDAKKDEFVGTAKKVAGKVTGDKELENEGKVEELKGKAESILADAKDAVKGALNGINNPK